MQTASEHNGKRWRRGVAVFAAAVLLLAQSLGAAHFHPLPSKQKYSANAAGGADNGLCAVCLVRAHSPTVSTISPFLTAPILFARVAACAARSRLRSAFHSHRFGRAPPASL